MRRGRSTGAPTTAQIARFDAIKLKGCVCCRIEGNGFVLCDVHHLNDGDHHGQIRQGHDETVGLCLWHHRGWCRPGWELDEMTYAYGPSWEREPNAFRERYGGADRLLQFQNEILNL